MSLTVHCFCSAAVDDGARRWKLLNCSTFEMRIAAGCRRLHGLDSGPLRIVVVHTLQRKVNNEDFWRGSIFTLGLNYRNNCIDDCIYIS